MSTPFSRLESLRPYAPIGGICIVVLLVALLRTNGRTPVSSSAMNSVGYSSGSQTLEIEFSGGEVYHYFEVPHEVYLGLMRADSHGRYFHQHIKGRYQYERVD